MLKLKKHAELRSLNTFDIDSAAKVLIELNSLKCVLEAISFISSFKQRMVLGHGSNVLFIGNYEGLIIYPQIFGIDLLKETDEFAYISVGASQSWHEFVCYSIKNGWFGLENLAKIPGTVGAAPIQNIGAYGVEVCQFIDQVDFVDLSSGKQLSLTNSGCHFGYRDSFFKQAPVGKYLITRVIFKLRKRPQLCLDYGPLAEFFKSKHFVTPEQVLSRVCQVRAEKLPDPLVLPNAGSFFKNPIVTESKYEKLKGAYPDLVSFKVKQGVKLAAAWLIEKAGFKGIKDEGVGVHQHQALVLVNYGEKDGKKIWQLAQRIQSKIMQQFDVMLEVEVRVVGNETIS